MSYIPKPLDTADIELPDELDALVERLAENVHEHWAQQRMAAGWVYGAEHNAQKKIHPALVAYADLPETEKEYDRITAMETLRTIVRLGYTLNLKEKE